MSPESKARDWEKEQKKEVSRARFVSIAAGKVRKSNERLFGKQISEDQVRRGGKGKREERKSKGKNPKKGPRSPTPRSEKLMETLACLGIRARRSLTKKWR